MNSLKASTKTGWIGYRRIVQARQAGWTTGWQFIGPSVNRRRFGGSFLEAVEKGRAADPAYWEFYAPDINQIQGVTDRIDAGSADEQYDTRPARAPDDPQGAQRLDATDS
jgi:hypothetical protein